MEAPPAAPQAEATLAPATPSEAASDIPAVPSNPPVPATLRELVDQAERESHAAFRHCYHLGLRYDDTQDGRVGVVLRVGATGKVESVETWGACDIAPEAIACMRDHARHMTLRPPLAGHETVVIPGVFTEGKARPRATNDAYTAAAYVSVETMRPQLHQCEDTAKREHALRSARATMTIDVDASGRASHVSIDDWKGSQPLLACAADVLREARYPPAPAGKGRIIAPIAFNPKLIW